MRFKQQPTLHAAPPPASTVSLFSLPSFTTTTRSIDDCKVASTPSPAVAKSKPSKRDDRAQTSESKKYVSSSNRNTTAIAHTINTLPTTEGLKPSYIILDEDISFPDAFRLLGRVVANVKTPLEEYLPARVIPGTEIPGLDISIPVLVSDILSRQSSLGSGASSTAASSAACSGTLFGVDGSVADREFAHNLEQYKSLLVFPNLPLSFSSSATATITHRSQYSKKTDSLLTALLGISISSSTTNVKTFHLESALIRTLSLTQHNLVWGALLDTYKKEITTAVRRNGGKMFLVIGVKVARDAAVEESVQSGRGLSGEVAMDVGTAAGVKGIGRVLVGGGRGGERTNIQSPKIGTRTVMTAGVVGGQQRSAQEHEGRKGRLLGDRAFAVEYREVRLKVKLEIGGYSKEIEKQKRKKVKEAAREREGNWQTASKTGTEEHSSQGDTGLNPYIQPESSTTYNLLFEDIQNQLDELRKQNEALKATHEQQQEKSRIRSEHQDPTPCKDRAPNVNIFTSPPAQRLSGQPLGLPYSLPAPLSLSDTLAIPISSSIASCSLPPQRNLTPLPQEGSDMPQSPVAQTSPRPLKRRRLQRKRSTEQERPSSLFENHNFRRRALYDPLFKIPRYEGGDRSGEGKFFYESDGNFCDEDPDPRPVVCSEHFEAYSTVQEIDYTPMLALSSSPTLSSGYRTLARYGADEGIFSRFLDSSLKEGLTKPKLQCSAYSGEWSRVRSTLPLGGVSINYRTRDSTNSSLSNRVNSREPTQFESDDETLGLDEIDDAYELELGEEVYVQHVDSLW